MMPPVTAPLLSSSSLIQFIFFLNTYSKRCSTSLKWQLHFTICLLLSSIPSHQYHLISFSFPFFVQKKHIWILIRTTNLIIHKVHLKYLTQSSGKLPLSISTQAIVFFLIFSYLIIQTIQFLRTQVVSWAVHSLKFSHLYNTLKKLLIFLKSWLNFYILFIQSNMRKRSIFFLFKIYSFITVI